MAQDCRIEADGLTKRYGPVVALDGVSLAVGAGALLAVLGHNGAGKTTLVDVLCTAVRADAGTARVCGCDVRTAGYRVRGLIGVVGQSVAIEESLTGRQNLELVARLRGARRGRARELAADLVAGFDLAAAADRPMRTYSGGMRRRLDLAAGLLGDPRVLFLDEPTTGLDPVSREEFWTRVRGLVLGGTTVLLTTQYLEEADRLADEVLVLAQGKVVAAGTPADLKSAFGHRVATVRFADRDAALAGSARLSARGYRCGFDAGTAAVSVRLPEPAAALAVARLLDRPDAAVTDLTVAEPSLTEVYLALHEKASA